MAQDMAHEALSRIAIHERVCEERNKRDDEFREDMKGYLRDFQSSYTNALADLRSAHLSAMGDLRKALTEHANADAENFSKIVDGQNAAIMAATKPLYNRFWTLAVSLIGGLCGLSLWLAAKVLNIA